MFSLTQKAYEIFESSEPEEKRQLLNFLLQNLQLDGKKLVFTAKTPFGEVLSANINHTWGAYWESNPEFKSHNLACYRYTIGTIFRFLNPSTPGGSRTLI